MIDREKVKKGVEHCFHGQECCGDIECPYYIEHLSDSCCLEECQENLKTDVIALLKEQQQQLWELQEQVEYLTDKQKEQEEIVRCISCTFYRSDGECALHNGKWKPEGFCSWAIRKKGR